MQVKITMRYHLTAVKLAYNKKNENNFGTVVGQKILSYTADGKTIWTLLKKN